MISKSINPHASGFGLTITSNGLSFTFSSAGREATRTFELGGKTIQMNSVDSTQDTGVFVTPCGKKKTVKQLIDLVQRFPKWFEKLAKNQVSSLEVVDVR